MPERQQIETYRLLREIDNQDLVTRQRIGTLAETSARQRIGGLSQEDCRDEITS
jgi:hypothetical protein